VTEAVIAATSVLCAGGFGADQVWASARARISRIRNSSVMNGHLQPIPMGLVPDDVLDPDDSKLDALSLPSRARRMLRLAAPPLRALASVTGEKPLVLYLGLPELPAAEAPWVSRFSEYLAARADVTLDEATSRTFPFGRASALRALESALSALAADVSQAILIGGVDTFLDLRLLATLGSEGRVLAPGGMDGFIPGEGAAFLLLKGVPAGPPPAGSVLIQGAASIADPGHRYGTAPARGEALAEALQLLRDRLASPIEAVGVTFAGLNGENFDAKLWGVARLRHNDLFSQDTTLEHPASCFGDTGAAAGAILTTLAATAVSAGHRTGPALVWVASDLETRACCLLAASREAEH